MGYNSHLKSESVCEKEYKMYCLNSGVCYYLVDEDTLSCDCTWFNGEKRCEKYMCWTYVKSSCSKSDAL